MEERNWLAKQFENNRTRLKQVAYRMLGSASEADDAVQEAWLRLSRSQADAIDNLAGWLTTVVGRICLDMLRARKARREEVLDIGDHPQIADTRATDPEREAILADTIGPALLVVLDLLTPAERVAFVLHDTFGMPFEEIASIVGRSEAASRQLASRARRRVRGAPQNATSRRGRGQAGGNPPGSADARDGHADPRRIVDAFLAAAREANFERLLDVLDPECVLRSDDLASSMGSPRMIEGRAGVAEFFNGRSAGASRATVGGVAGAAWAPRGKIRVAFKFTFRDGRIVDIEVIADPQRIEKLGVVLVES